MNFSAIIVCYNPDETKLMNLVSTLIDSNVNVYIANNGGLSNELKSALSKIGCLIKEMKKNVGIGAAINQVAAEWLPSEYPTAFFTFDQDSAPSMQFVEDMKNEWIASTKFYGAGVVLAPKYIDSRSGYIYQSVRHSTNEECLLVTLQSGMLIPFEVWAVCKFSDWLFIEFVDTEWCYYINSEGYKIVESKLASMLHEVSDEAPKKIGPWTLLKYSPIRRYYFFRNSVYLLGCNYVPLRSKYSIIRGGLNRFIAILLLDNQKSKSYWMSLKGIIAGISSLKRGRIINE